MLSPNEIKTFIDQDAASTKKQLAKVGLRYYEGEHDIKNYRIFYVDADGNLQEDKLKSNIKISHPFFKILVDQQAQYMLSGKEGYVKSDIPELQSEMDAYFNYNDEFNSELYDLLVGCISKGFEFMYAYKNAEGKIAFQCADSMGVIEIRAKETDDNCEYVIFWYIDRIGKDNKRIKRIQVWDSKQTVFYVQEEDGKIEPDNCFEYPKGSFTNVRPHITYKKDGDDAVYYEDFGFIPFFRLDNGKKQFSGLKPIKGLLDDFDLMACGLTNNIQDSNEVLYVVKGFEGNDLDELHLNTRTKKLVGVGEGGDIDIKTIDIPVEARKAKMEIDEKNIFRFGMGVNTEALKDTSATTSVAIKSAYANLDLKCEGLTKELKKFMRKIVGVVLNAINTENETDYQIKDIYFTFDREIITNAQENAQIKLLEAQEQQTRVTTILNTAAQFGNELTMQHLCEAYDLDYDDLKSKLPQPEDDDLYEAQSALAEVPIEE